MELAKKTKKTKNKKTVLFIFVILNATTIVICACIVRTSIKFFHIF